MAVVIFRQDRDDFQTWLYAELQAGRLRQGWGCVGNGANMALQDGQGVQIPRPAWELNYQLARPAWGPPGRRRYTILIRMLELGEGDVVIAPNTPNDGQFTLVCVNGPYEFDIPAEIDDFGHIIPVDPASVMIFANGQNAHTLTISGQRGYRDAVNIVQNPDIAAELNAALAGLGFECPA